MKNDMKLAPPKPKPKATQKEVKESPASSRLSSDKESKSIVVKVTPEMHSEIKIRAAARGLSIKDYFLQLYLNDAKNV